MTKTNIKFTIKNIKTFNGRDGNGFECSIYRNNKRVGTAYNDANGGENVIDLLTDGPKGEPFETRMARTKILRDEFQTFTAKFCEERALEVDTYWRCEDRWLDASVDDAAELKIIKRHCKTKTIFRTNEDAKGEWRSLNFKWSDPRAAQYLAEKYGTDIVIANRDCI